MYKLLVVDDESESRNLLCSYFPWNDLGFEIVDQLENGKTCLRVHFKYSCKCNPLRYKNAVFRWHWPCKRDI